MVKLKEVTRKELFYGTVIIWEDEVTKSRSVEFTSNKQDVIYQSIYFGPGSIKAVIKFLNFQIMEYVQPLKSFPEDVRIPK